MPKDRSPRLGIRILTSEERNWGAEMVLMTSRGYGRGKSSETIVCRGIRFGGGAFGCEPWSLVHSGVPHWEGKSDESVYGTERNKLTLFAA